MTIRCTLFAAAAAALALGLAACGTPAQTPATVAAVPAALQPAAGEKRAFVQHARGVQIYNCAAADGAAPAWAFVAPEAELFDSAASTTVIGSHGAGPSWQSPDGSKVAGKLKSRADAPTAGAIPWLLLATTSTGGAGKMAGVSSIQRVNTTGGVAPGGGCMSKDDVGKLARVPYTADYVFLVAGG
jgi:Protein of unknown function (DUF3455)